MGAAGRHGSLLPGEWSDLGVHEFTVAATQTEEGGGSLESMLTHGETTVGISEDNGGHCDQGSSRGLTPQDTGSHLTRVSLGQVPKVAATLPPNSVNPYFCHSIMASQWSQMKPIIHTLPGGCRGHAASKLE